MLAIVGKIEHFGDADAYIFILKPLELTVHLHQQPAQHTRQDGANPKERDDYT